MKKPNKEETDFTKKRYDATSIIYNLMEWPVEQLWYKKWRKQLWKNIQGPMVLEIGVGTGKNIPFYPEEIELTGIDLSTGMLKRAKKMLAEKHKGSVTLEKMDAQDIDFPVNHFDEVVATFVFCSVPDPILGLKEALRVTKPGGKLHLLEHMRAKQPFLAKVMDTLDNPIHFLIGVHIARETVANVTKAGWEIVQVEDLSAKGIFKRLEARKPH